MSNEGALESVLRLLINELLIVGNKTLGKSLTDSIELRNVATTGDSDTDVKAGELVKANNEERLENLYAEHLRLNEGDGDTVDLDEALSLLDMCNSGGRLLLAECLDAGNRGGAALRHDEYFEYVNSRFFQFSPLARSKPKLGVFWSRGFGKRAVEALVMALGHS